MIFDSHAHYDDEQFDIDREELLEMLPENGISNVINIGCDVKSSIKAIELSEQYPYIYASVGIHPEYADKVGESDLIQIEELLENEKVVAIGEIGLDYYYEDCADRDTQIDLFLKQLELCKKYDLPAIIHSREAAMDTFETIKSSGVKKGVVHCYSGSKEMALDYIKLGFYVGIGGVLTYKNARKTVEVVEEIPLDKILIETDAPYLSPVPMRGKRNDSSNLKYVCQKIAEIKNIDVRKVEKITEENAKKLFLDNKKRLLNSDKKRQKR